MLLILSGLVMNPHRSRTCELTTITCSSSRRVWNSVFWSYHPLLGHYPILRHSKESGRSCNSLHSPTFQKTSSLPERRWLNPQRSQIHISLPPMVNLVVNRVLDCIDAPTFPLPEGLVNLDETVRRNLREHCVQARGVFIP